MKIISAKYGNKLITDLIESKIKEGKLHLNVSNDICGDPLVGQIKWLEIEYELYGEIHLDKWKEGTICSIPKSSSNRLGIFYSNNNNPKIFPTIERSLKSIEMSSKNKADILTCMWFPFKENPFPEIISWYQSSSHLNQLLQVLQCLYTAREIGRYEYVSFLEHDVLYGEGYFDYPEFGMGEVITNMNFIGVNKEGWQPLNQRDEPFHQMTMHFEDAIKHCEEILPNALIRNSGLIESQSLARKQWESPNPSVHINHGHHFTSHFSIYGKANSIIHPYWGDCNQYSI
jgi:hypothetical protein